MLEELEGYQKQVLIVKHEKQDAAYLNQMVKLTCKIQEKSTQQFCKAQ